MTNVITNNFNSNNYRDLECTKSAFYEIILYYNWYEVIC